MKKNLALLLLCSINLFIVSSCTQSSSTEEVTIVFTNDIHSCIGNTTEDGIGLRLSKVGAYVDDLKSQKKNVLLVDAGDSVQGNVYGGYDSGNSVIDIMNKTGYDLSVPGNHDFDYSVPKFMENVKNSSFTYLSCNFVSLKTKEKMLPATKIYEFNKFKIGFVGISTPETLTTSTPTYFQDDKGNWIYDFIGSTDYKLLYSATQEAVDSIKDKVDFVVAIGHLGVEPMTVEHHIGSTSVINNTNGIDLFIDGHSHTLVNDKVKNKDNKEITLVQTGSYLKNFGVATILSDKSCNVKMESDYSKAKSTAQQAENTLIEKVNTLMGQKIANNESKFYVTNSEKPSQRLVRAREVNAGDLVADSFYWYLNEYKHLDCDMVLQNGGGVRAELEAGPITYGNLKNVEPFNNSACLIEATGQQIKDAIEMGVTCLEKWDTQWDCPAENGGFMQVAGLKYSVDCSKPSKVVVDDKGMFVKVDGDYRTTDIKVYNRTTHVYDDIVLTKTYRLGGTSYILRNSGNGLNMFKDDKTVVDFLDTDFQVFISYILSFTESEGLPLVKTSNSPLSKYTNYQINYEKPTGSERINILNLPK